MSRGAGPIDRGLLERMCVALEHRGPDSRGLFLERGVGLGIQRLRVVDLETGDQPIYNEDRTVVVVLNGEIYNFQELRDDLRRARPPIRDRRRHRDDRPPLRGARRRTASAICTGCSRSRSGTRVANGCSSLATASARSRCSIERTAGRSRSPRSCGRCSRTATIPREIDLERDRLLPAPTATSPRRSRPSASVRKLRRRTRCVMRGWAGDRVSATGAWTTRQAARGGSRELHEPIRERDPRGDHAGACVADVPARRVPVRRDRLLGAVVAAMAEAGGRAGQDLLDRVRSRRIQRATAYARRVAELFGTEHHEFVVAPGRDRGDSRRSSGTTASRSPTPRRSPASISPR